METKSKAFLAVYSGIVTLFTITFIILINKIVNFELGQLDGIKNSAQILVFTFGIFWIFTFFTSPLKQTLRFVIGTMILLVSFTLFVHQTFYNLNFIEQIFFNSYSSTDSLVLCFSGLYLMIYSYIKVPEISYA
ncbi:MAG: hypothetical protein PF488_01030 [Patescibacteria group bacterium]|jgi:hypothetical protein|nr:hypothetical protein [Patescibacteria group bacterium]